MSFLLRSFCFLFFVSSFLNTFASPKHHLCRPEQRDVLLEFRSEFEMSWFTKTESWTNTSDCCYWDGITCDAMSGEVMELDLSSDSLYGQLSSNSSLFKLKKLRVLDLARNDFKFSVIPSQFSSLLELRQLNLSDSGFSGLIPTEILHLTKLVSLDLKNDLLSVEKSFLGKLVQNLTNLQELNLESVDISSEIPQNISNLSSLRSLSLDGCNLSGKLPSSLFLIPTLQVIRLEGHPNLEGSLPEFNGNNSLVSLDLSLTSLSGNIPHSIDNLKHLDSLSLRSCNFSGKIPSSLGNLTHLSTLDLSTNFFTGTLPSALFDIPTLTSVHLEDNQLDKILEFGNSSSPSKLEELKLDRNNLRGSIPVSISRLVNLDTLDLSSSNNTANVDLSVIFSHLKSLSYLDLSGMQVSTAKVNSVSNLPSFLSYLYLSNCGITEFPNFVRNLECMYSLNLSNNKLKGQVPQWLWNHPSLYKVLLSGNSFTSLERSSNVSSRREFMLLDLRSNEFQGPLVIPPVFTEFILASNNNFSGRIPPSICEMRSLQILDLSNNSFTGSIPWCLRNLNVLNLRYNQLSGNIPDIFTNSTNLTSVDVSHNRLVGKLPRSLNSCSDLEVLNVGDNELEDTFPFWLNSLRELQVLALRNNKFNGLLHRPRHSFGFPRLQIVDVANNRFTGNLPSYYFADWNMTTRKDFQGFHYIGDRDETIGYYYHDSIVMSSKGVETRLDRIFTLLTAIDFSGNRLRGKIPESIGLLKDLIMLNLSSNGFSGSIPSSLANLTELESLDLSHNHLSGRIPPALGHLTSLSNITVSHNQLVGPIPQTTQFQTQSASSFQGNLGLCGLPLSEKCGTETPQDGESEQEEEEGVLSWTAVYIAIAPGIILGLTIGFIVMTQKPQWFMKKDTR